MTQACIARETKTPLSLWKRVKSLWVTPTPKKPEKLDVARLHPRMQRDIGLIDVEASRPIAPQRPGPYA